MQGEARQTQKRASALGYREPALFALWTRVSPGLGRGLVALYLAFGILATCSAFVLASAYVRHALALTAAAAVAAFYAVTAGTAKMPQVEPWAAALVLASCAAVALDARPGERTRLRWTLTAAAFALAAALVRELAAFALFGGLVWALMEGDRRRKTVWLAATLAFAAAYALHLRATGAPLTIFAPSAYPPLLAVRPLVVLTYGFEGVIGYPWAWLALALAGIMGALLPGTPRRKHLAVAIALPGVLFALVGPQGTMRIAPLAAMWGPLGWLFESEGMPLGYWGGLSLPLLLAASPLGLAAVLPAARKRR